MFKACIYSVWFCVVCLLDTCFGAEEIEKEKEKRWNLSAIRSLSHTKLSQRKCCLPVWLFMCIVYIEFGHCADCLISSLCWNKCTLLHEHYTYIIQTEPKGNICVQIRVNLEYTDTVSVYRIHRLCKKEQRSFYWFLEFRKKSFFLSSILFLWNKFYYNKIIVVQRNDQRLSPFIYKINKQANFQHYTGCYLEKSDLSHRDSHN